MDYRVFDTVAAKASLLGFGCMRFPQKGNEIDEAEAEKMIDTAYAQGVNYFDTAYVYHDGKSENFTGRVLSKYRRDSYFLATKLPCWLVQSVEDAERLFQEQLDRLGTDYIDFYLLHSLGEESWNRMVELGILSFCEELRKAGKIRYFGFSFHDEYSVFENIASYRKWDFCQIQLNYIDTETQAGMKGYLLTEKLGIPLVIMEPIKGGSLANLPEDMVKIFAKVTPGASPASFALRFIASLPNVKVILSGMSTMEQLVENVSLFSPLSPLTDKERAAIEEVSAAIKSKVRNGCTNCRYCMPCPAGVDIPGNFALWNERAMLNNVGAIRWFWGISMQDKVKAKNCVGCGKCEELCPQGLSIRDDLSVLQHELDELCK